MIATEKEGRRPAAAGALGALEHEIKYLVSSRRVAALAAWLPTVCLPDTRYPPAYVHTVYFDTPDLTLLAEKIASTYVKTKVRIRWYAPLGDPGHAGPTFVEAKFRVGNRRDKVRFEIGPAASALQRHALSHAAWQDALEPLRAAVPQLPTLLAPVLALRYVRRRFFDPRTASRLTLDEGIAVTALNAARVAGRIGPLESAVFEIKGPQAELPAHLHPVLRFGARRGCFSKYLACYQHATGLML
jgi:hypothetical protein